MFKEFKEDRIIGDNDNVINNLIVQMYIFPKINR